MSCLNFYTIRQWRFISQNAIQLLDSLSEEDRRIFYFDVREIDWKAYIRNYVLGARKYILKEADGSEPAARAVVTKLYWLQKGTHAVILLILAYIGYQLFCWILSGMAQAPMNVS